MTAERVFRVLWGPALENAIDFAWPTVGSSPLHWRAPRAQSQLVTSGTSSVALITGRYYRLKVTAQYFGATQNFGGTGLQAFLDWAMDSNVFTLMPNIAVPALTVSGCYLEGPFDALNPSLDQDATQTLDLTILHPTQDLGLAWRGLWFEYAAGGSLTDPVAYTYSRASVGYETNNQGYLTQNPSGTLCDGHYPDPTGTGLQTTLIESAVVNDVANPEALGSWSTLTNVTVTANNARAPDQNTTADLVVENTAVTVGHTIDSAAWTITANDTITALGFIRDGGRYKGILYAFSAGGFMGAQYDLHAGTVVNTPGGTGTVVASKITSLAGGWWMVWWRGTVGTGDTSVQFRLRLLDGSGNATYTGDGVSGTYLWGATAVHGSGIASKGVASYTPTTAVRDSLSAPVGFSPQAFWGYAKFVEGGTSFHPDDSASARYWQIGSNANDNKSRAILFAPNSTTVIRSLHANDANANVASDLTVTWGFGDTVEVLTLFYVDGSTQVIVAVNGAAEVRGTPSAALAWDATWDGGSTVFIGSRNGTQGVGYVGFANLKFGPGTVVSTIAQARPV